MKQFLSIAFSMLFFLSIGCKEQAKENNTSHDKEHSVPATHSKAEVADAVDQLYAAMVDRNEALLQQICANELTYGHSTGNIEDKKAFINEVVSGTYDYLSILPEDQSIYFSGDTAVVRHTFVAQSLDNGTPSNVRLGCMQIYRQFANGQWKIIARQAYKL